MSTGKYDDDRSPEVLAFIEDVVEVYNVEWLRAACDDTALGPTIPPFRAFGEALVRELPTSDYTCCVDVNEVGFAGVVIFRVDGSFCHAAEILVTEDAIAEVTNGMPGSHEDPVALARRIAAAARASTRRD